MRAIIPNRPSAIEKAMYALLVAKFHRSPDMAMKVYDDEAVRAVITRAVAPVGTTTTSGFASQLTQNLVGEFLGTLGPTSAAAAIMARGGLMVPMDSTASMKLPARAGGPTTTPSWTEEGEPISVSSFTLNDDCELSPKKSAIIIGLTREAARRASGEAVIRRLILEDASASLDGAYFGTQADSSSAHAGLFAGLTPILGWPGADREAMKTDLVALSDAISAGGSGQTVFVVSPKRFARVGLIWPELKATFLPSLALAEDAIGAVDPASLAHGFTDNFDIEAAEETTLHMDTEAQPIVDEGGVATGGPVRSMFQTDSLSLRLIVEIAFAARRTNAAALLTGATW